MNQETLMLLLKSVKSGDTGMVFPIIRDAFGEIAAAEAVSLTLERDEAAYVYLCDALGGAPEAERVLAEIWGEDRLMNARVGSPEFFFHISLTSYLPGEENAHLYRIGTTVRIVCGKPDIWFHHMVTSARLRDPEACIEWKQLQPEENALWSIFVSKILALPEQWFLDAAKQTNASLLIPYDLKQYE